MSLVNVKVERDAARLLYMWESDFTDNILRTAKELAVRDGSLCIDSKHLKSARTIIIENMRLSENISSVELKAA
jgi:hypothetical protein